MCRPLKARVRWWGSTSRLTGVLPAGTIEQLASYGHCLYGNLTDN